jgi:hypothetical protein
MIFLTVSIEERYSSFTTHVVQTWHLEGSC